MTIVTSLLIRSRALSLSPPQPLLPVLLALLAVAVVAAFLGTGLFERLSEPALERIIRASCLVIGLALLIEAMTTSAVTGALLPAAVWLPAAVLFGLAIGMVSSLLGVAGGEVIIPTLIFAYGVDIKTAGTASLLVSLPTVLVGIARHRRRGALYAPGRAVDGCADGRWFGHRRPDRGSARWADGRQPVEALLGVVLIVSALHMFRRH